MEITKNCGYEEERRPHGKVACQREPLLLPSHCISDIPEEMEGYT